MSPVVLAIALCLPEVAAANGRFPATTSTRFQPEDAQAILLPATFGLLISSDDGETFRWVCEEAIGYGGTYDPDYALAANGDIYATTFEGLRVSRDGGCTWVTIEEPFSGKWVGEVEVGPDGRVWATTSSGGEPNDVYVSEDGQSFATTGMEHPTAWWRSIKIAPSDPDRAYLTGFVIATSGGGGPETPPEALLYRTSDGGQSWDELPVDDFDFGAQPHLFVLGVSPVDPDIVFARVLGANEPFGDALYRSTDAGASWTRVLDMRDTINAFVIRDSGSTVIAGTVNPCEEDPTDAIKGCVRISHQAGAMGSFEAPETEPKMACIGERGDGVLFACGANWQPDFFALGRSTDGESWEKVVRFSEIAGPLSCPQETRQAECAALIWPSVCEQLGICTDVRPDAGGGGENGNGNGGGGGGCGCGATGSGAGLGLALGLAGLVFLGISRRRRARAAIRNF